MTTGHSHLRHAKWQNRPLWGLPISCLRCRFLTPPKPELGYRFERTVVTPCGWDCGFPPLCQGWLELASLTFALLFLHTFCLYCHFLCDFWSVFSLSLVRVDLSPDFSLTASHRVKQSTVPSQKYTVFFFRKYFLSCSLCVVFQCIKMNY